MKRNSLLSSLLIFVLAFTSCKKNEDDPTPSTGTAQQEVFKEYWGIYDRYYPLMARKGIDWQATYDANYSKITSSTTNDELFTILKNIMNTVVKDGHCHVEYNSIQDSYSPATVNQNLSDMVENNTPSLVQIEGGSDVNDYISYGTLISDSSIGYINSKTFEPITEDNDAEFIKYKKIVDEALNFLKNKDGIIIDVRMNGGGQSTFAFYLAGRFYSGANIAILRKRVKEKVGSTLSSLSDWKKQTFDGFADSRADGGRVAQVQPNDFIFSSSGDFQFSKKIAVLTSKNTASSGEFFTVAMKQNSEVETIGNLTFGIYAGSDIFTLKNGGGKWKTRVSVQDVEVLYDGDFKSFEGVGITPDQLLLPTKLDVDAGKDTHLEAAVSHINN